MQKKELKSVTFNAIFSKASTLVDGGWRISLDINTIDAEAVMKLAEMKDKLLQIAVIVIEIE